MARASDECLSLLYQRLVDDYHYCLALEGGEKGEQEGGSTSRYPGVFADSNPNFLLLFATPRGRNCCRYASSYV